jgi:hypothetical protein
LTKVDERRRSNEAAAAVGKNAAAVLSVGRKTERKMHKLIKSLENNGWKVKTTDAPFHFPGVITARYPNFPSVVGDVLSGINECTSADEKAWLLCLPDYQGNSRSAFLWNEFEVQSLEAAKGDREWEDEIVTFWNSHFPIYISVRDGYEYAAISLAPHSYGLIVTGREPEYEQTTSIAVNFTEFIKQIVK